MKGPQDSIPFHPYYTIKDTYGLGVLMVIWMGFVFFAPNFFLEPDNYIEANPLVTPTHIVPEWYLMPYYAILRAITFDIWFIPAKLIGVIAMFASILILLFLPWLDTSKVRSAKFRPIYKQFFWIFFADCLILGWIGASPPDALFMDTVPLLIIGRSPPPIISCTSSWCFRSSAGSSGRAWCRKASAPGWSRPSRRRRGRSDAHAVRPRRRPVRRPGAERHLRRRRHRRRGRQAEGP